MSEQYYDITQKFYKEVENLMFIVNKIIEANEQHHDINLFVNDLSTYYQAVKEVQLQKEEFNKKLIGRYDTTDLIK